MASVCPCTFGNNISHALNNLRKARKLNRELPEQTSVATVLSRKVDTCYSLEKSDSSWAYLVTFRLEDGQELTLKTTEETYGALKEGLSGMLHWQDDQLLSFI